MRKKYVVTGIFIFISFFLYIILYIEEKNIQYQNFIDMGENKSYITVFFSAESKDDNELYYDIIDALNAVNGNLYCYTVESEGKKQIYTKYAYIDDVEFFNFGRKTRFQVRTLLDYVNNNKNAFQKTFKLKVPNYPDFKSFQEILKEKGIVVSEGTDSAAGTFNVFPFAILLILLTDFVLMLIIFYELIKSFKQIGIEKMLGYDAGGIWSSRAIPIMVCEVCVFFITALFLSIILFDEFNVLVFKFIGKYVFFCILLSVFTLIFVSIPFSYVQKIPVYATLKNKKPLKEMIIFNMFIKGIVITTFLLVLSALYSQLALIKTQKKDAYKNWDKMRQYAYIYEECYTDGFFDDFSSENMKKWKLIYQEFNSYGAILADFSSYSPLHIEEQIKARFPCCYDVMVNPNYLKIFPVLDKNGNVIEISEKDEDYIVLVSEKYEKDEAEILSYYNELCENEEIFEKKIRIIWMQQGQKLFSCALDIGNNDCNCHSRFECCQVM